MITKDEVLMGREKTYSSEYTEEISNNIDKLLIPLNKLRIAYGNPMKVSSGWRPPSLNKKIKNAATKSNHCLGLACDFEDKDNKLMLWLWNNLQLLEKLGLYWEDPQYTKGWVHLQIVPPKSGNRIFKP